MDMNQNVFLSLWCKLLIASFSNQVSRVKSLVDSILCLDLAYDTIDELFSCNVNWVTYYWERRGGDTRKYGVLGRLMELYFGLDRIYDDVKTPVSAAILGGATQVLDYFFDQLGLTPDEQSLYVTVHFGSAEILADLLYREPQLANVKLGVDRVPIPVAIIKVSYYGFFNEYNWIRYNMMNSDRIMNRTLAMLETYVFIGDSEVSSLVYPYSGRSFLYEAIMKGVPTPICQWVARHSDIESMSITSYNGSTSLHAAVHRGQKDIATLLIMAGCDTTKEPIVDCQLNPERLVSPLVMLIDFAIFGNHIETQRVMKALLVTNCPFHAVKDSVRPYVINGPAVAYCFNQVGLKCDFTLKFRMTNPEMIKAIEHTPLSLQRLSSNCIRSTMRPGSAVDFKERVGQLGIPNLLTPFVIMSDLL